MLPLSLSGGVLHSVSFFCSSFQTKTTECGNQLNPWNSFLAKVKPPKEKHLRGGSFGGITYEKLLASQDTLTLREEIDLRDWLVARQFEMGIIRDELLTKWAAQPNRAQRTFVEVRNAPFV